MLPLAVFLLSCLTQVCLLLQLWSEFLFLSPFPTVTRQSSRFTVTDPYLLGGSKGREQFVQWFMCSYKFCNLRVIIAGRDGWYIMYFDQLGWTFWAGWRGAHWSNSCSVFMQNTLVWVRLRISRTMHLLHRVVLFSVSETVASPKTVANKDSTREDSQTDEIITCYEGLCYCSNMGKIREWGFWGVSQTLHNCA